MHVGAEGTGALHTKNKTEYFYGENRGNSIKFARTMIDEGADLVLGHGPHVPRAMEMYKGKLIAYSLGNFLGYRTLSTVAETGYSMILEVQMSPKGSVEKAKIIPVRMDGQGIPYIDQNFKTVQLVRYLNQSDFPNSSVKINNKGELLLAGQ
jgi:poly-gamma-glutamate capsule biosynthesis protein CapA/YwtB (metallophosphatase superfamily)